MKNIKTLLFLLLCVLFLNIGCGKDETPVQEDILEQSKEKEEEEEEENTDTDGIDYTQEVITIVLPPGSEIDLSNFKVQSVVDDFDIAADGSSTANFLENRTSIAYVIDANDNPILAGFINDEKREISARSTVEVSLYHTLGTIFLPPEIKELYIKEISKGINIDDIVVKSEDILRSNGALLGQASFLTEIQTTTEKFTKDLDDASQKTNTNPGIRFNNIEQSGVRLTEEPGNNIIFRNTLRRRAHAFFYKTKTTNEDEQETTLINDIVVENSVTSKQVIIPPTEAVTSVIGLLQTIVSGKGLKIGAVDSAPMVLAVTGDNLKATYQARVVGPGRLTIEGLTDEEAQKLLELNIETFAFDILIPIISTAIGNTKILKSSDPGVQEFIGEVTKAIGNLNGANEAAKTGDFNKLTSSFLEGMANSTTVGSFEPVLRSAVKIILLYGVDESGRRVLPAARDKILGNLGKFFKLLKAADLLLQGIDLVRISGAIGTSKPVENFEIEVTRGIVALEPYLAKTKFEDDEVLYTAKVIGQDLAAGQAFEYVWTSEGDFGILVDDNTNRTDAKTLTTSVNTIKYRAEASGSGSDEIKVEVFIKEGVNKTRVDDDIAFVDVVDFEMKITPNNATILGGTDLTLSVVTEKTGNGLVSDENFEYSYEWRTNGQFGQFNGTRDRASTTANSVMYEALERTLTGTENISVSIYRKDKGRNGNSRFLQTVEGTINISEPCKNEEESIFKASFEINGLTRQFEGFNNILRGDNGNGYIVITGTGAITDAGFQAPKIVLRTFNYKGVGTYPIGKADEFNEGWDAALVLNGNAFWKSFDPPSGTITITEECTTYIKGTFSFTARISGSRTAEITNGNFVSNF